MTTHTLTVSAPTAPAALDKVETLLKAKNVPGFQVSNVTARSERLLLWTVELADCGGDLSDLWVVATSYGMILDASRPHAWDTLDRIEATR